MHLQANYPLKAFNTFGFDVKTRYIAAIYRTSDIQALRKDPVLASLPWQVIGDGANLLIGQDMDGVIIRCGFNAIDIMAEDEDHIWLSVGGGRGWHDLVQYTVQQGWWGLENLALIPGTVGAAPFQNIGAYGVEVRDIITRVQTLDLFSGERVEFRNTNCEFEYRSSIFKKRHRNQHLIHRVTFRLLKAHAGKPNLTYDDVYEKTHQLATDGEHITSQDVFNAIVAIRRSKLPDPQVLGNAGSYFKNPVISQYHLEELKKHLALTYDETVAGSLPVYPLNADKVKVSAAWLIEQAGWKGHQREHVGVYHQHALILTHRGGGQPSELAQLAKDIQQDVLEKFSVHLEPEVETI